MLKGKQLSAEEKGKYVIKGGSFVDSKDGRTNYEARCSARYLLKYVYLGVSMYLNRYT